MDSLATQPQASQSCGATVAPASATSKKDASGRKAQLRREIEQLLEERKHLRDECQRLKAQPEELRQAQQKEMANRIAEARERGMALFPDFVAVVAGVAVDGQAFEALLTSTNGPELMYALGLGFRIINGMRQLQRQINADGQRVEYYRQQHQKHFAGVTNG